MCDVLYTCIPCGLVHLIFHSFFWKVGLQLKQHTFKLSYHIVKSPLDIINTRLTWMRQDADIIYNLFSQWQRWKITQPMWRLVKKKKKKKCCKNNQMARGRRYITKAMKGQIWDFGAKCWTPYANFIAHSSWVRNPVHDLNVINILQVFPSSRFPVLGVKGQV